MHQHLLTLTCSLTELLISYSFWHEQLHRDQKSARTKMKNPIYFSPSFSLLELFIVDLSSKWNSPNTTDARQRNLEKTGFLRRSRSGIQQSSAQKIHCDGKVHPLEPLLRLLHVTFMSAQARQLSGALRMCGGPLVSRSGSNQCEGKESFRTPNADLSLFLLVIFEVVGIIASCRRISRCARRLRSRSRTDAAAEDRKPSSRSNTAEGGGGSFSVDSREGSLTEWSLPSDHPEHESNSSEDRNSGNRGSRSMLGRAPDGAGGEPGPTFPPVAELPGGDDRRITVSLPYCDHDRSILGSTIMIVDLSSTR